MNYLSRVREIDRLKEARASVGGVCLNAILASDFVTGGRAEFARACSRAGDVIETIRRPPEEPYGSFLDRARARAATLRAPRLVIGGIDSSFDPDSLSSEVAPSPQEAIILPDNGGLHAGQQRAMRAILDHKRVVLRMGRRWGKSATLIAIAADEALRGRPVGYFSPLFKTATPVFDQLALMLGPLIVTRNRSVGELRLSTGGVIDVWSIETSTIVARGRKYARCLLDEIAFCKTNVGLLWRASIAPTLVDLNGSATVASTPWGVDPANWFYQICNDKTLGWVELHAPSETNPYLSREALEEERRRNSPLVWRQEFEGEFTSLDAAALINVAKLLTPNGEPWPEPLHFDYIFVVVDSAIKTGSSNDGTAALFCAMTGVYGERPLLWFLDYDVVQVSAGVIERWFEGVAERAREIMGERTLHAGPIYVEDAATGPILLEKYPTLTEALLHAWTREGKDLRAYASQAYFNGGQVRIAENCYRKTISFKGVAVNHLWTQLNAFVLGDKEASKRADDLLDAAVYAAALAFRQRPVEN